MPANRLVRTAGVGDSVICLLRVVGPSGRLPSRGSRASSGEDFFAPRPVVVATTMVIGAPRAPVFGDGIDAVAKHGQMTGGPGDSLNRLPLLGTGVISGDPALATRTPLSDLFGCPSLDLRTKPELHAPLAEIDRGRWHVLVLPLVLEHGVPVGEAQDVGDALGV
jgi:hypothetical protein